MNVYLDNNPVQYPEDSMLYPTFTQRRKDEEGFKAFSFTGDMTFRGSDFDYLKLKLKTDANALTNVVKLKFEYICCATTQYYNFRITADSITWCDNECTITCAATEDHQDVERIACLKSTLIADNWNNFKSQQHPRFSYCNEIRPDWNHHLLIILSGLLFIILIPALTPIIAIVALIVNVVNNIVSWANTFPFINIDGINDTTQNIADAVNTLIGWVDKSIDLLAGCGRKHPSPLIRDYAENVCGKCGLTFQSSIFTNPSSQYFNACYHFAPVHKGTEIWDTTTYWLDQNEPYMTGFGFFDKLKGLFNGDWYISGNTLIFERKDLVPNNGTWLDLTQLNSEDYTCCYNWAKSKRYAYGDFHYSQDSINSVGNEAITRWGDIVEWNQPNPTSQQKGDLKPVVEFAACRFRNDGIDTDILSQYNWIPVFHNKVNNYSTSLILNQHVCFLPMILIWDGNSRDDARVSPYNVQPSHPWGGTNQMYNYNMWFWEHGNVSIYGDVTNSDNNLYTNFWYIENPRVSGYLGIEYDAEVELTCDRLLAMSLDGTVKTNEGTGKVREIVINFKDMTMNIKGEI